MRRSVFAVLMATLFISSCSTVPYRSPTSISKDQAVLIARHETAKLSWMHANNEMAITVWDEREAFRANKKSPKRRKDELLGRLKGKRFWKVAFDYKPGTASNEPDAVVYLNRDDGSVISIHFGEIKGR